MKKNYYVELGEGLNESTAQDLRQKIIKGLEKELKISTIFNQEDETHKASIGFPGDKQRVQVFTIMGRHFSINSRGYEPQRIEECIKSSIGAHDATLNEPSVHIPDHLRSYI